MLERALPALDGSGLFEADEPATLGHLQPGFGLALSYRRDVQSLADGEVDTVIAGHVRLGFGLLDRVQLSAGFPLLLARDGATAVSSEGLGDGFLAIKTRLFGPARGDGVSVGALLSANLPFGTTGKYLRDVRGSVNGALLLALRQGRFALLLDAGAGQGRDAAVRDARMADEATGVAALVFGLIPDTLFLGVEAAGHMPTTDDAADPWLEPRLGLKVVLGRESVLAVAIGRGVGGSFGSPRWSGLLVWSFRPDARDTDADGVYVPHDRCPDEAEDRDGFQDLDGCPDPDNDGDGVPDDDDACPELAEDRNEYEDEDGCPDAHDDADGDRVYDVMDQCLHEPEDHDGYRDFDGCPDPDNDGDGVADGADRCPQEREDPDGFQDGDGCPDPDNDQDGLLDLEDPCPNEAEDYNGLDDTDGCPEAVAQRRSRKAGAAPGGPLAVLEGDRIRILEPIHFKHDSANIESGSLRVIDAVFGVIGGDRRIIRVRVEGHTDGVGSRQHNLALSARWAQAVADYLVRAGVPKDALLPRGFGPDRPVASDMTPDGRAANRRVEFIVER